MWLLPDMRYTNHAEKFQPSHLACHIFEDSVKNLVQKAARSIFNSTSKLPEKLNVSSFHLFIYIFCVMCLEMSNMICFSSLQSSACSWLLLDELEMGKSRSLCRLGELDQWCFTEEKTSCVSFKTSLIHHFFLF